MKQAIILLGFCGLLTVMFWKASEKPAHTLHGSAMGVRWNLQWRGNSPPPVQLHREVAATLEKWEQVLSQWRHHSDLSRHNRGETPTADLARVVALAEDFKKQTHGAFDHHILEKVHAAGFGPAGNGIDLSSIGKGFAADRVGEKLRELGVNDFIFSLAGEVLVGDAAWPVAIERPDLARTNTSRTITLTRQAVATSGNYRQFRQTKNGLVSHIIDPKTGQSVIRPPSSVTVIAPDCATASSWATALFVLGTEFADYPNTLKVFWQH